MLDCKDSNVKNKKDSNVTENLLSWKAPLLPTQSSQHGKHSKL